MKRGLTVLAGFVVCMAVTAGAAAQGQSNKPQGKTTAPAGDKVSAALPPSEPVFTMKEVTTITTWFRENHGKLPPGLAKRETLPPGLEQQLQKKGKLPPGLAKKIQPMPVVLEKQLIVLPTGYRRVVIGGNVIIMNSVTGMVYDIVRGVL